MLEGQTGHGGTLMGHGNDFFLQLFTYLDISSLRALRALQALRACFGSSPILEVTFQEDYLK